MKVHRNLCQAIVVAIRDILLEKKQADTTVAHLLTTNKSWGARDRHFIADHIYGIVRFKRYYEFLIDEEIWSEGSIWRALGACLFTENIDWPEWDEFKLLSRTNLEHKQINTDIPFRIRQSIPDWLDNLGRAQLGSRWENEIKAQNSQAHVCIRINTLKSNKQIVSTILKNEGVDFTDTDAATDALVLNSRKNIRNLAAYKNGLFEIQDVSSQLIAPFLAPEPGMNVIDGCAGAGGKTLHLAAMMKNQGQILAVDVNENKMRQLKIRAARAGCSIVVCLNKDELTKSKQILLQNSADRILLDVPCSGTGVLRRKPDSKWNLTEKFLNELQNVQSTILDEYAPMLRSNGVLVYSTCSLLPSENNLQIEKFLQRNLNRFRLLEEKTISTYETGFDGFYMAKLIRNS